jgi:RHS repeat-associated protein
MRRTDPDPENLDTGSDPSWQYNFYGITGQRLVTVGCTNPSGTPLQPTCLVQGENVYFGRKLLVSNGATVVTDRLGSVRANTQGERFAYYPYGEERTTTPDGREKFGTYFRDGVGQDYARARYYGSGTGRFWSPDPTTDSVDYPDPTSWNAYAYVNGDPINFNDPTGLQVSIPIDDGGSPDSCLNQKLIPWMQQNGFAVTGDLGSLFNTPTGVLGLTLYYEDTTGSQALYTDMAQVMLNRYYIQMSNGKLAGQLGIASGSFTSVVESSSNVWSGGSLLSADYNDLINVLNGDVVSRQSAVNAAACSELISALNASLAAQSYVGKSVLLPGSTVSTATYWFFLPGSDPVAHQYWLTKTSGPIDGFLFETLIGPRAPLPRKKRPRRPAHGEGDF